MCAPRLNSRGELGHIPGSRNIPVEELQHRLDELDSNRERPIIVVCRTERRSAKAAGLLNQVGFNQVAVLRGGMSQWNSAGLPIERISG